MFVTLALAVAIATSGCNVEAAPRATHPAPDAGSRPDPSRPADARDEVVETPDSEMGLTRAQVRARRGPPTEIRGNDWIYTPAQPGCREVIISQVLTFKRGVVARFDLQRRQTGKVCRRMR